MPLMRICERMCLVLNVPELLRSASRIRRCKCPVFRRVRKNRDKSTISFVISVRPSARDNSALTGRIFMKFDIWLFFFFRNLLRKFKFRWNLTRITGTLHEDVLTFKTLSRWIILRMRNVLDRSCRGNRNKFHFQQLFFFTKIVPFMR
jgi:hypothetical protein